MLVAWESVNGLKDLTSPNAGSFLNQHSIFVFEHFQTLSLLVQLLYIEGYKILRVIELYFVQSWYMTRLKT